MKKLLKSISLIILILLCNLLIFYGCTQYKDPNLYGYYQDGEKIFMKQGEACGLDIKRLFGSFPDLKDYALKSSDTSVATVNGNKIFARSVGKATIWVTLKGAGNITNESCAATVFITDENKMTEIYSAQDLDNIRNDLNGFYILKSDIDLADWVNWQPIGQWKVSKFGYSNKPFAGIFINPYGYSIKNLSVEIAAESDPDVNHAKDEAGLFAEIAGGYIDGIILEDVRISSLNSGQSMA